MNPQQKAYRLLGILQSYATTPAQAQACANIYNRAVMEEVSYEVITTIMANTLADGLNYGNWPWASWTHGRDDKSVIEAAEVNKPDVQKMTRITRDEMNLMRRPGYEIEEQTWETQDRLMVERSVDAMTAAPDTDRT